MKIFQTVALLLASNLFMNLAWYGHLKLFGTSSKTPVVLIILVSWGLALFEYCFQVPANRIGAQQTGGPFSLLQLKMLQEVISLLSFLLVAWVLFRKLDFGWNQLVSLVLLVGAVYFMFKK